MSVLNNTATKVKVAGEQQWLKYRSGLSVNQMWISVKSKKATYLI